jgi:hypothetical protein
MCRFCGYKFAPEEMAELQRLEQERQAELERRKKKEREEEERFGKGKRRSMNAGIIPR